MQHLNCVQKIRTKRNIQWKFELHFLLFQVKEEIVLFPKKKMYFLPLLINLNSVISEVKTLDLNTQVSKKSFFNWICFKLKVSSNAY